MFAKTKEVKRKTAKKLLIEINDIHQKIKDIIFTGRKLTSTAGIKLSNITTTMDTLIDQMLYFIETGFVANKKIIHLGMEELYSIVRGKAGKSVEFGLKWGINRLGGGYLQGFLIGNAAHKSDKQFCLESVKKHISLFSEAPEFFGFDRGGYSKENIKKIKKLGVQHVGIAPTGKTEWEVGDVIKKAITRERAQVEGAIGVIKSPIYGFNKPDARSIKSMKAYGHRAILGFNLRKLAREFTTEAN